MLGPAIGSALPQPFQTTRVEPLSRETLATESPLAVGSPKRTGNGDELGNYDAQQHQLQIRNDVQQRLLHVGSPQGVAGLSPLGLPTGESPPTKGEAFECGQAIALANAMTWDKTMIRTMSFRFVITFNSASFMVSPQSTGETTPLGRGLPKG